MLLKGILLTTLILAWGTIWASINGKIPLELAILSGLTCTAISVGCALYRWKGAKNEEASRK